MPGGGIEEAPGGSPGGKGGGGSPDAPADRPTGCIGVGVGPRAGSTQY